MNKSPVQQDDDYLFYFDKCTAADKAELLAWLSDADKKLCYAAARELQIKGGQDVFSHAKMLCASDKHDLREIGAFLLGQLGTPTYPFSRESEPILSRLALHDPEPDVRANAVSSLGHLAQPESFETLIRCINDSSHDVRHSVAFALGEFKREDAVPYLLSLTYDTQTEVRDWATFSLNMIDSGSVQVRDRFVELLNDTSDEVRIEAIKGLAHWRDGRVFSALEEELSKEDVYFDMIECAGELGDGRLLPRLRELQQAWGDDAPHELKTAIERLC